jgi:triosephosphate isomerase
MRKNIAAGNWKMFKDASSASDLFEKLASAKIPENVVTVIAPPYIYLKDFTEKAASKERFFVAAQNCHHATEGAFTGEVSAMMLKSIDVPYVIIGHSERREQHYESNEILRLKVLEALKFGLIPIFCCGEALEIRKNETHIAFVTNQLTESLAGLDNEQITKIVIAYEPIWAIGTGETASPEQAQEMHSAIRSHMSNLFSEDIAREMSILYGGSVKASNAKELFSKPDVDGGLVGGAALDADSFITIIHSFE